MKRYTCFLLLCCLMSACTNRITLTPPATSTPDPSTYSRVVTREAGPSVPLPEPTDTPRRRLRPYPSPTFALYVVQQGDNLKKIAQDNGTSLEALIVANGIDNPDYLRVGQSLMIPPPDVTPSAPGRLARMTLEAALSQKRPVATLAPGTTSGRRESIVYLVDEDDHYHTESCPLLRKKNPIPMTCQEAIEMGYTTCRTCNPACP